jgi:CBS domain-containing protein
MLTLAPNPLHRLEELVVADVMTRNVAVIPAAATMDEAAQLLASLGVSGAPVVDNERRCIGVLSAADFLRYQQGEPKNPPARSDVRCQHLPWDSVLSQMTVPVRTVWLAESMMHAAELMCKENIHRLIVVDDLANPIGVVSTLDVVSAVVHAVDEGRQEQRSAARRNAS